MEMDEKWKSSSRELWQGTSWMVNNQRYASARALRKPRGGEEEEEEASALQNPRMRRAAGEELGPSLCCNFVSRYR